MNMASKPQVHETILAFEHAEAAARAEAAPDHTKLAQLQQQLNSSNEERLQLQRQLDEIKEEAEAKLASLTEALTAATDEVEGEGRLTAVGLDLAAWKLHLCVQVICV